jgi:hypothetical protein
MNITARARYNGGRGTYGIDNSKRAFLNIFMSRVRRRNQSVFPDRALFSLFRSNDALDQTVVSAEPLRLPRLIRYLEILDRK